MYLAVVSPSKHSKRVNKNLGCYFWAGISCSELYDNHNFHILPLFTFTLKTEANILSKTSAATYNTTVRILNVINSLQCLSQETTI